METDFQSLDLNVLVCLVEILENDYVGYSWLFYARCGLESNICDALIGVWRLELVRYLSARWEPMNGLCSKAVKCIMNNQSNLASRDISYDSGADISS